MELVQNTPSSTDSRSTIEVLKDNLDDAFLRIGGLEEELAEKRKEITRLERRLARVESEGVKTGLAEEMFDLWVNLCRKRASTKFGPDRRREINAALKLYGEADVRKVIAQLAKTPFLVYGHQWKPKGDHKPDIVDVLGKGKHFDALLELANTTPDIDWTEDRMREAHSLLLSTEAVLDRIQEGRGWTATTLETLGVGLAEGRLIFPVRDSGGTLTAVIKYHPRLRKEDKDLVKSYADGPRGLFPAPESVDSATIWLVEGEPDAVTAHEMWLPGVGVPGAAISPGDWMKRLKDKKVVICFDCDHAGRSAANRIARPLTQYATEVRIVDIEPTRADGFDLSDWFQRGSTRKALEALARLAKPVSSVQTPQLLPQQRSSNPEDHDALFDDFVRCLEQKDCEPKEHRGGQWVSRCPAHDDKVPTLYFKRGGQTPVVTDCKAGCSWPAIKEAVDWPRKEF